MNLTVFIHQEIAHFKFPEPAKSSESKVIQCISVAVDLTILVAACVPCPHYRLCFQARSVS